MIKVGHLIPATVIKAYPEHSSYLMVIADTAIMALLPRVDAGKNLRVGDSTIASVLSIDADRIYLTQITAPFYRKLVELLLSPLLMEDKIRVHRAAAIRGTGFAKVAMSSNNGCNPIAISLPYIVASKQYTDTTITLVRYSSCIEEYVANAFAPAPAGDIWEVIYFRDMNEIHVTVNPRTLGLFVGKGGTNVATVSKLIGIHTFVKPGREA